jgi:hypothetical protein
MARNEKSDQQITQAVALGQQNQALLPRLRNWCRHLQITDYSGGLIHELYGLPMNLELCCPHAAGQYRAMNLEWNARMFIDEKCVNCAFHDEVFPQNFGREVLAQREQAEQAAALHAQEQATRRAELQADIDALLKDEQTQGDTKSLSILKLVQQLGRPQADHAVAATVLEAARLSPSFFTPSALNYLALHLDASHAPVVLQILRTLLDAGHQLADFARQQLLAVVEEGEVLDAAVGVLAAVAPVDLVAQPGLLSRILGRLHYEHHSRRAHETEMIYPEVVALLQRWAAADVAAYEQLLKQQLSLPNKHDRLRVLGLLQDLATVAPGLVLPLTEAVARSLAFEEDGYGDSADHAARHLLASLYAHDPETVFATLRELYTSVTASVQLELLEFYGRALCDDELVRPAHAAVWVSHLVSGMVTPGPDARKDAAQQQVEDVAYRAPHLLVPHQDAVLGALVAAVGSYRKFQWFRAELQNSSAPPTTFNPLLGRHGVEIQGLDLQEQRRLHKAELTVEHLLRAGQQNLPQAIVTLMERVSSEADGLLKARLLKVLRSGLSDPLSIGRTLPVLYTSLFDTVTRDVRYEALRSVEHLLDQHPQCVTVTLLGVVKVLLNDPDVAIRGQAIRAYGALLRQFPEALEPEHLQRILAAITNKYRALHKAAAATALSIAPFLAAEQRLLLLVGVLQLEEVYYAEQDYAYCKELIGMALRLAQEAPAQRLRIVEHYVVKYCNCGEIYTEKDFMERLTQLTAEEPQLRPAWLAQALAYMQRVEPEFSSHVDLREVLLPALQQLPYAEVVAHQEVLEEFVRAQIRAGHYQDVYGVYAVFGAQGLHAPLHALTRYFTQQVPATKANAHALEVNATVKRLSGLEAAVAAGQVDNTVLTALCPR